MTDRSKDIVRKELLLQLKIVKSILDLKGNNLNPLIIQDLECNICVSQSRCMNRIHLYSPLCFDGDVMPANVEELSVGKYKTNLTCLTRTKNMNKIQIHDT